MEQIRKAIELAKGTPAATLQPQTPMGLPSLPLPPFQSNGDAADLPRSWGKEIKLNEALLESHRIVAHDVADPRSRSFDMLRTPVLQSMDMKSWQFVGVTSPTPACGKTIISVNLALSIARQQERSVLLLDLDLRRPQLADCLGLKCEQDLLGVLKEKTTLSSAIIRAKVRNHTFSVLPCAKPTLHASEWMASRAMSELLKEIKRDFNNWTVIVDLPPILTGDDVISLLPQIDCVLFVTAIGTTTIAEVKECYKHLEASPIVRAVANKAPNSLPTHYYGRYSELRSER